MRYQSLWQRQERRLPAWMRSRKNILRFFVPAKFSAPRRGASCLQAPALLASHFAPSEPTARSGGPGGSAPHRGRAGHRAPPLGCSPGSFSLPCPSRAFSWAAARCHRACTGAADTVLGPGWALPVCSRCRHAPVRSANSYCSMICGFISNCCLSEEPRPPSLFVVLSLVPSGSRQPQVYFGFAWLQK